MASCLKAATKRQYQKVRAQVPTSFRMIDSSTRNTCKCARIGMHNVAKAATLWVQSHRVTEPIKLPLWRHYASQVRLLYVCYARCLEWRSCWKPGLEPQAQRGSSTLLSRPSTRRNLEPQTEVASRIFVPVNVGPSPEIAAPFSLQPEASPSF
jgi:hypothetical protein